jgi:hypothetical protein
MSRSRNVVTATTSSWSAPVPELNNRRVPLPRGKVLGESSSIMPTVVSGNTNATAIMIGEKGAGMVLHAA